jgi:hypothetical protein
MRYVCREFDGPIVAALSANLSQIEPRNPAHGTSGAFGSGEPAASEVAPVTSPVFPLYTVMDIVRELPEQHVVYYPPYPQNKPVQVSAEKVPDSSEVFGLGRAHFIACRILNNGDSWETCARLWEISASGTKHLFHHYALALHRSGEGIPDAKSYYVRSHDDKALALRTWDSLSSEEKDYWHENAVISVKLGQSYPLV